MIEEHVKIYPNADLQTTPMDPANTRVKILVGLSTIPVIEVLKIITNEKIDTSYM
ncbi:MAG: hypothetical protein V5A88_05620 [Candidatus Thermoplasmatota archaeon]